jgi:hypothetical protein
VGHSFDGPSQPQPALLLVLLVLSVNKKCHEYKEKNAFFAT